MTYNEQSGEAVTDQIRKTLDHWRQDKLSQKMYQMISKMIN